MILDTNILIEYFNGEESTLQAIDDWKKNRTALFISSVSFTETLAFPPLTPERIENVKNFLRGFIFVSPNEEISEKAAHMRRIHLLEFPDATIAATALVYRMPLVTRDRQFKKVKEISVIVP